RYHQRHRRTSRRAVTFKTAPPRIAWCHNCRHQHRNPTNVANRQGSAVGGYFVAPTVSANATDKMCIAREEIFGPVMNVPVFDDENDAIAHASASASELRIAAARAPAGSTIQRHTHWATRWRRDAHQNTMRPWRALTWRSPTLIRAIDERRIRLRHRWCWKRRLRASGASSRRWQASRAGARIWRL